MCVLCVLVQLYLNEFHVYIRSVNKTYMTCKKLNVKRKNGFPVNDTRCNRYLNFSYILDFNIEVRLEEMDYLCVTPVSTHCPHFNI